VVIDSMAFWVLVLLEGPYGRPFERSIILQQLNKVVEVVPRSLVLFLLLNDFSRVGTDRVELDTTAFILAPEQR